MAGEFQTIDLTAVDTQLRIEVVDGGKNIDDKPVTFFYVRPPLPDSEYLNLLEQEGPDSEISELLQGSFEKDGDYSLLSANGEPGQEHVDLGVTLAKKMIELRGISSGKVVATIGETATEYLVLAQ